MINLTEPQMREMVRIAQIEGVDFATYLRTMEVLLRETTGRTFDYDRVLAWVRNSATFTNLYTGTFNATQAVDGEPVVFNYTVPRTPQPIPLDDRAEKWLEQEREKQNLRIERFKKIRDDFDDITGDFYLECAERRIIDRYAAFVFGTNWEFALNDMVNIADRIKKACVARGYTVEFGVLTNSIQRTQICVYATLPDDWKPTTNEE